MLLDITTNSSVHIRVLLADRVGSFFITISPIAWHYSMRTSAEPESWKLTGAEKLIPVGTELITASSTKEYQITVSDTGNVVCYLPCKLLKAHLKYPD